MAHITQQYCQSCHTITHHRNGKCIVCNNRNELMRENFSKQIKDICSSEKQYSKLKF